MGFPALSNTRFLALQVSYQVIPAPLQKIPHCTLRPCSNPPAAASICAAEQITEVQGLTALQYPYCRNKRFST